MSKGKRLKPFLIHRLALKNASRIRLDISQIHTKYEKSSLRSLSFHSSKTSNQFLSIREIIRKGSGVPIKKITKHNNPEETTTHTSNIFMARFVIMKQPCQVVLKSSEFFTSDKKQLPNYETTVIKKLNKMKLFAHLTSLFRLTATDKIKLRNFKSTSVR